MKRRLEEIFYLCAYRVIDLSPLVVLMIFETISVLMTIDASCRSFVASVPFWPFLAGKYALENSSIVVVCPFRYFLVSFILGHAVIDLPCVAMRGCFLVQTDL